MKNAQANAPQARKGRQTMVFHTMPEYEEWKESLGVGGTKGWDIKYYKGLGTSTNDEAREYFANIEGNRKEFVWTGERCLCTRPEPLLQALEGLRTQIMCMSSKHAHSPNVRRCCKVCMASILCSAPCATCTMMAGRRMRRVCDLVT